MMNLNVTLTTENQRFSVARRHNLHPCRLLFSAFHVQIRKFTNMVYFNVFLASA